MPFPFIDYNELILKGKQDLPNFESHNGYTMIGEAKKNHMSVPRNQDFYPKKSYQIFADDEEAL